MNAFRPAPAPLKSRLLTNPFFHISILFLVVFSGTLYIVRQQQKQEISRRVEYLKGGPLYTDTTPAAGKISTQTAPDTSADSLPPPPPPPSQNAVATGSAPVASSTATPPSAAVGTPISATMAKPEAGERRGAGRQVRLKAYYTLMPTSLQNQISLEPPVVQFGPVFRMGQVRNFSQVLGKADVLDSSEVKFEPDSSEVTWIAGEKIQDGFLGLQVHVSVLNHDDSTIHGEIEISRALPEDASQAIIPVSFPGEFSTAPGSAVMISMVFPRVQPPARSMASASKFFRFYRTTDFVSKNSEFVMFLVFE